MFCSRVVYISSDGTRRFSRSTEEFCQGITAPLRAETAGESAGAERERERVSGNGTRTASPRRVHDGSSAMCPRSSCSMVPPCHRQEGRFRQAHHGFEGMYMCICAFIVFVRTHIISHIGDGSHRACGLHAGEGSVCARMGYGRYTTWAV